MSAVLKMRCISSFKLFVIAFCLLLFSLTGCKGFLAEETSAAQQESTEEVAQKLSDVAIKQARNLGGVSHRGEELFAIVGDSFHTEKEANAAIKQAHPFFGDMQDYFIVQTASCVEGLPVKKYSVIELYKIRLHAEENLSFAERSFVKPRIVKVHILRDDPLPVYEDVVL